MSEHESASHSEVESSEPQLPCSPISSRKLDEILSDNRLFSSLTKTKAETPAEKADRRHTKGGRDDEDTMLDEEEDESVRPPPTLKFGKLRPYQEDGLEWMVGLRKREINGILADEMGLGKTVQTVALIDWIRYYADTPGPHLVIAPKSTLSNWRIEFERWTPHINILVLIGNKEERKNLIDTRVKTDDFDVIISSYEIIIKEQAHLRKVSFDTVVVDEAHRLKNESSLLSRVLRTFSSAHRILLTGTPLQNNLKELWALLNFLVPEQFSDSGLFESMFENVDEEQHTEIVHKLHRVLKPFILRRVKADVETLPPKKTATILCQLSDVQRKIYKDILSGHVDALGAGTGRTNVGRLHNILMQLWKACNHPYLFEGVEPGPPYSDGPHLWENCGKLRILDKLLPRLHADGHRVLVFSQMTRMMDILEDYIAMKGYSYCRIDGQTSSEEREEHIASFNAEDSTKFIFLLSTRAGGLGINLATADTVVLYDTSWNPQQDLQAMDRAHRIGQKKPVNVYRFITEHTVEQKIQERSEMKLQLDTLVIEQGRLPEKQKAATKEELLALVTHGAEEIFKAKGTVLSDTDIDKLLERAVQHDEQRGEILAGHKDNLLQMITSGEHDTGYIYEFEGEKFKRDAAKKAETVALLALDAERDKLRTARARALTDEVKRPKNAGKGKRPDYPEWQFYAKPLVALCEIEQAHWKDEKNPPLTAEQKAQKAELLAKEPFAHWKHGDFRIYIKCCELFGKDSHERIAEELDRDVEDIRAYGKVLWSNLDRLADGKKLEERVLKGDQRREKAAEVTALLRSVAAGCKGPSRIIIPYPQGQSNKQFTDREDRWLVYHAADLGYGSWDELQRKARTDPETCLDWFLKSRTTTELQRRVDVLVRWLARKAGDDGQGKRAKTA
ncbi:chromatin-remodeling complex ATPase chain [Carpediemonas membranifera]|uniref:Chromatin-remodeling complex ATPase chain n=1 Tax=Carpediemonas membranifera TaxID=201153 RepID=A0A8J6B191_9EUKA|nr:chromatin-remodeling complex ATPase chain [Carpediemonas membranifera]|eukprot:KAG9396285.1 chromatin-remodeling complex ATPase chain [Carpediemonas membranifera]